MKLGGLAAIGLMLWAPAAQRFKVNAEAVALDVLVTEGRNAVVGLTAADFELRDSGVVQRIESVSLEDVPLNVMMVLDTSESVDGPRLVHLKDAAASVVDLLTPADRAALMTFNGALQLRAPWTSDRALLRAAIAATDASGSTALHDAAYAALTLRAAQPGRRLVLIFSDGADTASWLPGKNVLEIASRNDAVAYAVTLEDQADPAPAGITSLLGAKTAPHPASGYRLDFRSGIQDGIPHVSPAMLLQQFLDALADETGGKTVRAERSDRLRETFVQVMREFRSRYLITYIPRGVDASGWHPLEVKLKGKRGKVTARRGYLR